MFWLYNCQRVSSLYVNGLISDIGKRQWYLEQCRLLLAVVTRRTTAQFLVVRLVVEGLLELVSRKCSWQVAKRHCLLFYCRALN